MSWGTYFVFLLTMFLNMAILVTIMFSTKFVQNKFKPEKLLKLMIGTQFGLVVLYSPWIYSYSIGSHSLNHNNNESGNSAMRDDIYEADIVSFILNFLLVPSLIVDGHLYLMMKRGRKVLASLLLSNTIWSLLAFNYMERAFGFILGNVKNQSRYEMQVYITQEKQCQMDFSLFILHAILVFVKNIDYKFKKLLQLFALYIIFFIIYLNQYYNEKGAQGFIYKPNLFLCVMVFIFTLLSFVKDRLAPDVLKMKKKDDDYQESSEALNSLPNIFENEGNVIIEFN